MLQSGPGWPVLLAPCTSLEDPYCRLDRVKPFTRLSRSVDHAGVGDAHLSGFLPGRARLLCSEGSMPGPREWPPWRCCQTGWGLDPILLTADFLDPHAAPDPLDCSAHFCMLTLPWFGFAWAYYGSPLPATLATKQQQGAMVVSQLFAPGFLSLARDYARWWQYLVGAGLALLGVFYLARSACRWALFLSWTVLYFTAFSILGVSRYYWYYAPLVPGFLRQGWDFGGEELMTDDRRQTADPGPRSLVYRPSSVVSGPIVFPVAPARRGTGHAGMFQLRHQYDRRAVIYHQVGNGSENTAPGDLVGALEVGIWPLCPATGG